MPSYDTSATLSVDQVHPQVDLVAAGRVDVAHLDLERLAQAAPARLLVVVQDHLLVELLQLHQANTPRTLLQPATSASISSVVL